jgi:hypothetical protein
MAGEALVAWNRTQPLGKEVSQRHPFWGRRLGFTGLAPVLAPAPPDAQTVAARALAAAMLAADALAIEQGGTGDIAARAYIEQYELPHNPLTEEAIPGPNAPEPSVAWTSPDFPEGHIGPDGGPYMV